MHDIIKKATELLTPALVMHTDIIAKRAQGIYVEDINGKRYMDFTAGLAVANTGHNHPRVVEAIKKQADALIKYKSGKISSETAYFITNRLSHLPRRSRILPRPASICFSSGIQARRRLRAHSSSRDFIPVGRASLPSRAVFMEGH